MQRNCCGQKHKRQLDVAQKEVNKMKKAYRTLVAIAVVAIFAFALCVCLAGCNSSWDVSASSNGKISASLVQTGNTYALHVVGNGAMKDFASPADAPWCKNASSITSVVLGEGIVYVGNNAFVGTSITHLVLPQSVGAVGENAIPVEAPYFAQTDGIEFAEEDLAKVYTYREEPVQTVSRHWQSDKNTNSNVFDFDNPDELFATDGNYWHYNDNGEAERWQKTRVLFVGNSFTYTNVVPEIFHQLVNQMGYLVDTYSITGPGWYLENHAKPTDQCGKQVNALLNARSDFDFVVLQEQSTCAFANYDRFLRGVQNMQALIESTQDHAQIYLYSTWGYMKSAPSYGWDIPQMEMAVRQGYEKAAQATGVKISYVGRAFTELVLANSSINLYATDKHHQSYAGSYLGACVHAATLLGADVTKATYGGSLTDQSVLQQLREVACAVAFDEEYVPSEGDDDDQNSDQNNDQNNNQNQQKDQTKVLVVASWGRFISEAKTQKLVDGFKQYCQSQGIEYEEISYIYYTGKAQSDPYYFIANFTAKVVQDGNVDIVLPCADNIKTNPDSQIINMVVGDLVAIDVYGQTNRRVAKLNNDQLTQAFMQYVQTTEAQSILAEAN